MKALSAGTSFVAMSSLRERQQLRIKLIWAGGHIDTENKPPICVLYSIVLQGGEDLLQGGEDP